MILPPSVLHRVYEPLLRKIPADEAWAAALRKAAGRGVVVHVVRNVSLLDLLALIHLSQRHGLPEIAFANDFQEVLPGASRRAAGDAAERLRSAVRAGKSAVLFLKRAPGVIERASTAHRGRTEGDALLSALLDIAAQSPRDVLLVPETLVWTMRPQRVGFSLYDFLFRPAEFPGEVRALAHLIANHEHVVIRAGEPLSLRELRAADDAADPFLVRRLTYALLRRSERERKSVVGPARKPPDRVREEVLRTPRLSAALRDAAGGDEAKLEDTVAKARGMLHDLQADPDPATLRVLEVLADTIAERVFAGIDVDEEGIERAREAARKGSIVLLPSHKSHVDYLLLHYVLRKHALSLPLVAAGDNLSFFPIGALLRRSGAFFIRRNFRGEKLYALVVDAYVRRLLRDGYSIEFFLEGGRSRTGKLLPPQVGLLNMVVEAALGPLGKPVSFVPVSIGYERMMEETEFLGELSGGAKKGEDLSSLVSAGRALLGSYGRPNVQLGRPIDLGELRQSLGIAEEPSPAKRRALVSQIAQLVMDEINRVTAVTPGSLVATVLLCHPRRGMPHTELVQRARRLLQLVRSMGARTTPSVTEGPGGDLREASIREAAEVYVRGGLLRRHVPGDTLTGMKDKAPRGESAASDGGGAGAGTSANAIWIVPEERRIALDISKNMIVHLFVERALLAIALGARHAGSYASVADAASEAAVLARARWLARLFRFEFNLRADSAFEAKLSRTLGEMMAAGEIARAADGALSPGEGHDGQDGRGWLLFYSAVLRNFLEGYRVAARALRTLVSGPAEPRELVLRALRIGEQMFLGGEIERAEAVSRPIIENAVLAFRDLGFVTRDGDVVALADAHRTEAGAAAVEAEIAPFLERAAFDSGF
jgi:glycerol-3-phosphate O-acyltransferase